MLNLTAKAQLMEYITTICSAANSYLNLKRNNQYDCTITYATSLQWLQYSLCIKYGNRFMNCSFLMFWNKMWKNCKSKLVGNYNACLITNKSLHRCAEQLQVTGPNGHWLSFGLVNHPRAEQQRYQQNCWIQKCSQNKEWYKYCILLQGSHYFVRKNIR